MGAVEILCFPTVDTLGRRVFGGSLGGNVGDEVGIARPDTQFPSDFEYSRSERWKIQAARQPLEVA